MLRSPRAVAFLSVGAALSLLVLAVLVAPEMLHLRATGDAGFGFAGLLRDSHLLLASPVLISLRSAVSDLEGRAAAKLAEIKDDLDGEALRRIEGEHAELLRQLEGARGRLTAYEAAPPAPAPQADPAAAVRAERERIRSISEIATRAGMDQAAVDAAITADTSVEAFRAQAFDVVAGRAAARPTSPIAETRGGQDDTETRREAMVEYVLYRGGKGPLTERAREMYRGMSAVDLARETLGWRGEKVRGLLPDEIAQRSLMASSDFPSILAAGANKTLRAGYVAAPRTFKPWVRNIPLPDFKAYNIVRRGETPQLAKVNEKGEFQRGAITESKEAIKLGTYGVVAGMTRQMIVNDDLGAFLGIPGDFGQSSATLESDIVYGLFLSNPALLTDGKAVFHADHKNLAVAVALGLLPVSAMRAAMGLMTGLDGVTLLNITPRYLLVPPELETPAEQLTASVIVANEVSRAVPESIRSLKPIAEGRLSVGVKNKGAGVQASGSSTAYYLISDQVDSIVTATLEGQDGPYIETRMGFDVDGVEIKCRHDFGAAAADHRGVQKNPGA